MPYPFPGMNPYFEHPEIWPGVHLLLIAALADSLASQLRPEYSVSVEVRMYEATGDHSLLVGVPDVAIQKATRNTSEKSNVAIAQTHPQPLTVRIPMPLTVRQGFLEIREVSTKEVVTVIELLSPINKRAEKGRATYETKRQRILGSDTHLVEIDLLRAHQPMPMFGDRIESDYRMLVSRTETRPQAELYTFNLQESIPSFSLPLRPGNIEPTVYIHQLLEDIYDRSGYDLKLDYSKAPVPALGDSDSIWLDTLLAATPLR
ncbi:MAG: DUF4058 family protein [Cyanobacteria bacterium P01_D01_bin.1]